ncbi:MAG: protein kinase [Candidatus Obscuribacterales bacterium]|nr:protein kinase [Candidatus Obscuribacterales bacterium]
MQSVFGARYETIDKIGSGANSDLYKAKDLSLNKIVALKVLRASETTPKQIVRLQTEARILSQMQHRNLVQVFDFSVDDGGSPFLVMELIDGISLSEHVKRNCPLQIAQCISIFKQICSGLEYAHNRSIFHRDLKPSNIMLSDEGSASPTAKIVDFGIAKSEDEDSKAAFRISIQHGLLGSPLYMAPDIARGKPADRRSDIYSLGCLFFFSITGQPPFRGNTINDTILMHVNDAPPRVSSLRDAEEGIPELEQLISKMLRKDPDQRFQSVEEIGDELEHIALLVETNEGSTGKQHEEPSSPKPEVQLKRSTKLVILVASIATFLSLLYVTAQFLSDAQPKTEFDSAVQEHWKQTIRADFDAVSKNFDIYSEPNIFKFASNFHPYLQELVPWVRVIGIIDDHILERMLPAAAKQGQYIRLYHKDITGESFKVLNNRRILGLDLTACKVSNLGLSTISKIASLQLLILNKLDTISDDGISHMKNMPNLKFLSLRFDRLTDKVTYTVSEIQTLEGLDLTGNEITDEGLQQIIKLKKLKSLGIGETRINKSCLKSLTERYELTGLDLSGLEINDDDLDLIIGEPLLCLSLNNNSRITRAGLLKLRKISTLRFLMISSCSGLDEVSVRQLSIERPDVMIHLKADTLRAGKMLGKDTTGEDGDRVNQAY